MGLFDDFAGPALAKGPAADTTRPDPAAALRPLNDDTWGRMERDYYRGRVKGETTHISELDEHFKWMPGYCNVWTGWPGDGKTEWIYQLLLLRAVFKRKKSAIFSPENMPEEQIYDQLIHALTGQNPDRSWQNCLSMERYKLAKEFIREHFFVVYPSKGMGRTPQHLLSYFEAAISKYGVTHCLLDPWNKVDHAAMNALGGYEPYLTNVLGQLTDWTVDTKQSLIITAHPKRLDGLKYGQARPIPDGTSISGGQTWENMAHVIGTVYRAFKHLGKKDPLFKEVTIYLHKVKSHKLVGFPGSIGAGSERDNISLTYDLQQARYLVNGMSPLDCRAAEAFYLPAAELNAHHAVPAVTRSPLPASDDFPADDLDNWHPHGKPITLPTP
jgi:twinkle protein